MYIRQNEGKSTALVYENVNEGKMVRKDEEEEVSGY
jgi:hypothetical protein